MYETQTIAAQALRELLNDSDRDDWDELLAANRALIKAIVTGKPMTRKDARIVAEYLREAGWRDRAIGAATANERYYGRPHRGRGSRDCPPEAWRSTFRFAAVGRAPARARSGLERVPGRLRGEFQITDIGPQSQPNTRSDRD
jgi:hypothetical protein